MREGARLNIFLAVAMASFIGAIASAFTSRRKHIPHGEQHRMCSVRVMVDVHYDKRKHREMFVVTNKPS